MIDASSNWRITRIRFVILFLVIISTTSVFSQNLLTNGDFELGNNVGFSSNYGFIPAPTGNTSAGQYGVGANPQPYNTSSFISIGDHTSGTGNMMIVDGTNNSGNPEPFFWRVNNNGEICGLTVGVTYTFSYWVRSIYNSGITGASPANIGIKWNNVQDQNGQGFINPIGGVTAPNQASGWQQVKYEIIPTNACVRIEMFNWNGSLPGNDFAIDDIELLPPVQPLSLSYSFNNISCPGANDGFIAAYGKGGVKPYAYTLSGGLTATNSDGVFSNLSPGNYNILVRDAAGTVTPLTPITLAQDAGVLVITGAPTGAICSGQSVTLTASGASAYTWSILPSAATVSTDNPFIVTPSQTTTYKVSSSTTTTTTGSNLIFNGNFSQGNVGFQTDYQFANSIIPNKQRYFGIQTNPKNWFIDFSACPDKTNGTGNMMVVDGSIFDVEKDRLWCQTVPVKSGTNYELSFWVQTLVSQNPAKIRVKINGVIQNITPFSLPITTCSWVDTTITWNSGTAEKAEICFYNLTNTVAGNDFALDDISLKAIGTTTCAPSADVTITVNNCGCSDISNASSAQTLCIGGVPSIFTVNTDVVGTNSVTYKYYTSQQTGNAMYTGGTDLGKVTPSGGTATYNAGALGTPGSLPNTAGTYYVYAILNTPPADPNCRPFAEFKITVTTPTVPTFTQVAPICSGEAFTLPTTSNNNITGNWSPSIDNTTTTIYKFTPTAGICATPAQMTVTVNQPVTPTFTQVAPICSGGSFTLPTTSNNGITGIWLPPINNTTTTNYIFTPNTGECANTNQMTVIVNTAPTLVLTEGNNAQSICEGRSITNITYTFGGSATSASVSGLPAGLTATVNGSTITISGTADAPTSVAVPYTVTTSGGNCGIATAGGTITVNPLPVVSAGPDRKVELGKTVVLNGTASGSNNNILWTPPTGLSSTDTLTPVATITQATTYTLAVTSQFGCTTTDQVLVTLLMPIDVPNVFSPNGDGVHERWVIRNIELYPDAVVQVYDRYGNLLIERFGYNSGNAWDGTFNGNPVPVGAYYYIIRLSPDKEPIAGSISIIR